MNYLRGACNLLLLQPISSLLPSLTRINHGVVTFAFWDCKPSLPIVLREDEECGEANGLYCGQIPIKTVQSRQHMIRISILNVIGAASSGLICKIPPAAIAAPSKSRTDGYSIRKTDAEWSDILSPEQYFILRKGGTERPNSSILEGEDRPGTYVCAGCGAELFDALEKFHSGTGWPSFASALSGVEVEEVNPVMANLAGAEVRCANCGGHLGDVFNDGKLFVKTPAFRTGKRYCIDGWALVFKPQGVNAEDMRGDRPPPMPATWTKVPGFLEPPKIVERSR